MTMVEQVARAVRPDFDELYRDKGHYRADNHGLGGERKSDFGINGPFQSDILEDARAAIQAMMEPDAKMLAAMIEVLAGEFMDKGFVEKAYRAALQAALDEKPL